MKMSGEISEVEQMRVIAEPQYRRQVTRPVISILSLIVGCVGALIAMGAIPHCGSYQTVKSADRAHNEIQTIISTHADRNNAEHDRMYQTLQKTIDRIEQRDVRRDKALERLDTRTWQIWREVKRR